MVKLEHGWMTDATIHAVQGAFVSSEPIPYLLLPLLFSLYDLIFMPLIPTSAIFFLVLSTRILVFIWHFSFLTLTLKEAIPLANHRNRAFPSNGG